MRWMFHESQWALESLYSLFSVAQITASQLQSIQQSLHALDSAACPSCGHIYALLHCLLFSVLLDAPLLDSTLHPFSYPSPSSFSATFLPLLTHLSTAEPSTLSFALGLALLRDDSSSTCVLAVSSGLSAHELHRIHRSIAALGFLDLPPCARSRCLSLLYRALIVFIERYVLASCPLASLKSLREQYAHLAVAPPASAFPDGVETLVEALCALLPLLDAPLRDAPIDSLLLFLLDRLAAQPCFFDCTLRLLTAVAALSPQAASAVRSLLLSYDSPMISWRLLLSSLQQALQHVLQPRAAPLCPDDISGITAILDLMAALLQDPEARQAVLQETGFNLCSLSLQLLPQKLPLPLLAALCRVLARCAEDPAGMRAIWSHLETFCTAYGASAPFSSSLMASSSSLMSSSSSLMASSSSSGGAMRSLASLRAAWQTEETPHREHALSRAFLSLLEAVLAKLPLASLQRSTGFFALLEFVVQDVLLGAQPRDFRDDGEFWAIQAASLRLLRLCVARLAEAAPSANPAGSGVAALVAELLVPSPLLRRVLSVQSTELPLFPPSDAPERASSPADRMEAIAAASLLLGELLRLPASFIDALHRSLQASAASAASAATSGRRVASMKDAGTVRPLAQQLSADSGTLLRLFMQLCIATQPALQCATLQILSQLAAQSTPAAFASFFGGFGEELALLRTACRQIWTRAMQSESMGTQRAQGNQGNQGTQGSEDGIQAENDSLLAARCLLDLLMQQASVSPSLTSLLLDIPAVLFPGGFFHDSFLARLCAFLVSPFNVLHNASLALDALRLLELLANPGHSAGNALLASLAGSGIAAKMLAMLPCLVRWTQRHADAQTNASLLQFVACSARLLSTLLFTFTHETRAELVREVLPSFALPVPGVSDAFADRETLNETPIERLLGALRGFALTEIPRGFIPENWLAQCETSVSTFGSTVPCIDLVKLRDLAANEASEAKSAASEAKSAANGSAWHASLVEQVLEAARQANEAAARSALEKRVFHSVLTLLQIALIDCNALWTGLLPPSAPITAEALPAGVIGALLAFLAQATPPNLLRADACEAAIAFLRLLTEQNRVLNASERHQCLEHMLVCILNEPLRQSQAARTAQYLLLLQFLLGLKKASPDRSLRELFTPSQLALPALLELLAVDLQSSDAALHKAATTLLRSFIAEDSSESITHYLLQHTSLLPTLLQTISQLDFAWLEAPATARESLAIVTQSLSLLSVLVRSTEAAMAALDLSLFGRFNHCPLIRSLRENGASLSLLQTEKARPALRGVLRLVLQVILSVEATVRPIRSIQSELTAFVLAVAPLTPFLFQVSEEDTMALEVLGLFLGTLVVLANQPERLVEMMNGYEGVLKTEVVRLLNSVSKKERVCKCIQKSMRGMKTDEMKSKKMRLYKVLVENGMLFMSKMGWKIGDEYLRAFGVRY